MINAFDLGDPSRANEMQMLAIRMIDTLVQGGVHPIATFKWFMGRVAIDCGPTRLPLVGLTPEQMLALETKLEALKIYDWVK